MPVTTRAAALKAKNNEAEKVLIKISNKNKNKSHSKQQSVQHDDQPLQQQEEQPPRNCVQSEVQSSLEQPSTSLKNDLMFRVGTQNQDEVKNQEDDIYISIANLFNDQESMLSTTNEEKDGHTTSSLLTDPTTLATTEIEKAEHPKLSVLTSHDNDIYLDDSNVAMNDSVVGGDITYGTSTRGGKMIYMNLYGYIFMTETKNHIGWRCVKRNEQCKAVIYTFKSTGQFSHWNRKGHCHGVDLCDTRKREILSKIKSRVLDEFLPIKRIIEEEYRKANLSIEEKRIMPLPSQIESGLHKLRRKALPPIPSDHKFIIPDEYKQTYSNDKFLLYDKRKSAYGGRLIIFSSEEQLKVLLQSEVLFADGTFKVAPKLFEQLYVIHGFQHGEAVPVCFVLTSNRKQETYAAILRCLNRTATNLNINFQPTTVVCDFEQAFINAVNEQLPNTSITGCWFHFCQSCYRNLQKHGLMSLYDDHAESRQLLRSFMGLALLSVHQIYKGFELLKQKMITCEHRQQLKVFVSYFEHEWMQGFHPSMWSVSKKEWRTNNFAEAQNRRFSSRVVQPHPNLWRFIQCLKQEESVVSHRMVQTGLGFSSTKESKSTRKAAQKTKQVEKLLKLLESNSRSLSDTIGAFAHLVGEPVGRGRKGKKKKKHNVTTSDVSNTSSGSDHD